MKYCLAFILLIQPFFQANAQAKKPTQTATKQPVVAGRNIAITLTPFKNTKVYLGSYYGKNKVLVDSAVLGPDSKGVFKGNTKLPGGIYFVVSAQYAILFELLMDNKQQFSIVADTSNKENPIITGSPDNDLFKNYSAFSIQKGRKMQEAERRYHTASSKTDSSAARNEVLQIQKEIKAYQNNIIKTQPKSLLTTLFKTMRNPEAPPIPIINGKPDSLYPYRYVKDHYWDEVNFSDDRILRTPFLEPRIDEFFKNYVSVEADSIIPEVQFMLLSARTTKELYPYLLTKFTNKYLNPEYMGQDKVFVYLFENFYLKGDTSFLNAESKRMIIKKGYSMLANQLGQQAPVLNFTDKEGKLKNLYDVDANFTFVAFWDPHCGHCKEMIPRVDSFYKAKWQKNNVAIYAVNVDEKILDDWNKFIQEKNLVNWVHVYQTAAAKAAEEKAGLANFRQLYDISMTPTFYLLDKQKRIIAKQLTLEQFDDLMERKLKGL